MKINNVDIVNFGAQLISYEVTDSNISYKEEWAPQALTPITSLENVKYTRLKINLLVQASDRTQVEKYKSLITSNFRKGVVAFDDTTLLYEGVAEGITFSKISNLYYKATINFNCLVFEPETTINLNKSYTQSVNIKGNSEVEVIYTITTPSTIPQLTINDITVNNIQANSTVIIDGVNKKVTSNGTNKFKDCEFTKFPTLVAGNNTITINVLTATITLKYKPRWC